MKKVGEACSALPGGRRFGRKVGTFQMGMNLTMAAGVWGCGGVLAKDASPIGCRGRKDQEEIVTFL